MLDQKALGRRIQDKRKMKGITQEQLGNRVGVSSQAVSKWENGESTPDIGLLPTLCKTLGCSADTLLGIIGEYRPVPCKKGIETDVNTFRFESVEVCHSDESVFIRATVTTAWDDGSVILFNPPDCTVFGLAQYNVLKPGLNSVTFEVKREVLVEDTITMKFFPGEMDPPGSPRAWLSFRVCDLVTTSSHYLEEL